MYWKTRKEGMGIGVFCDAKVCSNEIVAYRKDENTLTFDASIS